MASSTRTPQQDNNSSSFSRRYFHFNNKTKVAEDHSCDEEQHSNNNMRGVLKLNKSSSSSSSSNADSQFAPKNPSAPPPPPPQSSAKQARTKKLSVLAVSKLKTALALSKAKAHFASSHGTKVIGTLFGHRRGHVLLSFQHEFKAEPSFIVELATPTSVLVKEMASGLVRIALECDKKAERKGSPYKLIEEPFWRTYCNGKKCGYAIKRECGAEEWKVLNSIGQISMGAGVLPAVPGSGNAAAGDGGKDGEIMYMRAKFERVVGNKDSEAYYMMNPDGNGGPELSVYLLRV